MLVNKDALVANFKVSLKDIMEAHGITGMDLIRNAGVSPKLVYAWRRGDLKRLDAEAVGRILRYLNQVKGLDIKFGDLIDFEE